MANDSIKVKPVQSRYITVDEPTFQNLTGNELKIYMALRYESDYSKQYSDVELTIEFIATQANVSQRKVYEALNILEFTHYLIQRINYKSFKYGVTNSFSVSRDYMFFKQKEQELITPAENDMGVQIFTTPADSAVTPAENDIPNRSLIFSLKEEEEEAKPIPSFFNDMQEARLLRIRREARNLPDIPDKQFLEICELHVKSETTKNKNFNKAQRIGGLSQLIAAGDFEPPVAYTAKKEEEKKIIIKTRNIEYQEYAGGLKQDKELKLIPESTKILTYQEWINEH